ncbi:hypothetical protein [uncultured Alteromonas sp.]|jgi:hypothetical protein|uniref:hypothetical protein n=1 Tax=uncultured Alteromonas sp. TaxID=179113 RepID=UPI0030D8579A
MKNKLGILLFLLGIFPGLYFLGFTFYGYARILNCYGTPGCSELLMIPAVSSLFGFPSWLAVVVGLNLMEKRF